MTKDEDPKNHNPKEEERKRGLRRREFVKLVGGTGVAATAQVLAGHKIASAATTTVPEDRREKSLRPRHLRCMHHHRQWQTHVLLQRPSH